MKTHLEPKLELVARDVGSEDVLLIGVLMTDKPFAGDKDIEGVEVYGMSSNSDGTIEVLVTHKKAKPLTNNYGYNTKLECLSALPTFDVWPRYENHDANRFGGYMYGRENQYFEEEATDLSRMAVVSVLSNSKKALGGIDGHKVFRTTKCIEYREGYQFTLEPDETCDVEKLFGGEGLIGMWRKPVWTLPTGETYRLNSTDAKLKRDVFKKSRIEILKDGKISDDTKERARNLNVSIHLDSDFVSYIKDMDTEGADLFKQYSNLISENEHECFSKMTRSVLSK
ncbi:hypothetical protein QTV43_000664 [Vibrio vulnificus]|nr:hypothetical protein [Vibrio vulnificus]